MELFWIGLFCVAVIWIFVSFVLRRIKVSGLEGRYVFVTGCDSGFGYVLVKRLDRLQFNVFAGCLTKEGARKLTEECTENVMAIELDITKDANIEKALEIVHRRLPEDKGLWALVNNAGIFGYLGDSTWLTRQEYENVLDVNLLGMIMVTKACLPLLRKERGRIVNTSSVLGRFAAINAPYAISKYGIEAFSDILRLENYKKGVAVSIVEPGSFNTSILTTEKLLKDLQVIVNRLPAEIKRELPDNIVEKHFRMVVDLLIVSSNLDAVIDAYTHAITAKYPRTRYLVGYDARFLFCPIWNLPTCVRDYIVSKLRKGM